MYCNTQSFRNLAFYHMASKKQEIDCRSLSRVEADTGSVAEQPPSISAAWLTWQFFWLCHLHVDSPWNQHAEFYHLQLELTAGVATLVEQTKKPPDRTSGPMSSGRDLKSSSSAPVGFRTE